VPARVLLHVPAKVVINQRVRDEGVDLRRLCDYGLDLRRRPGLH